MDKVIKEPGTAVLPSITQSKKPNRCPSPRTVVTPVDCLRIAPTVAVPSMMPFHAKKRITMLTPQLVGLMLIPFWPLLFKNADISNTHQSLRM